MIGRAGLALLVAVAPAAAQDAGPARAAVEACLATTPAEDARAACLGVYARDCMAAEGGDTTAGMTDCTAAETAAWDQLLNEAYAALVIAAKRQTIQEGEAGAEPMPHEEMLRAAQRAWLDYRDADCAQERAIWGQGSMGRVAGAYCMLERTAARVFELEAKRAMMEPE